MIRHKLHRHLLPHYVVSPEYAGSFGGHNVIHHPAHALSTGALFIYLSVLVFAVAALYFVRLSAPQILGEVIFSVQEIINLTNEERAKFGLPQLSTNGQLSQAAQAKAADMFANDYWAHNSPSGRTPWSFITAAGYKYVFAGENLARDFGDPAAVVGAWMDSPSHRSNILDKNFREIGVGVSSGRLTGREGILVVQMFGTSVSGVPRLSESGQPTAVAGETSATESAAQKAQNLTVPETFEAQPTVATEVSVLSGRQFSIAKGVSLALVGFIFLLFALEVAVTARREHVSLRPGVIAHLAILGFLLFAVWYAVGGAIL